MVPLVVLLSCDRVINCMKEKQEAVTDTILMKVLEDGW